jgi:hypothetical protein
VSADVYLRIFDMFARLTYLNFHPRPNDHNLGLRLDYLPSTAFVSSTLVHLHISVQTFEDCLCLLDGRLSQLSTFIVEIGFINFSFMIIDTPVGTLINIRIVYNALIRFP